MSQSRRGLRPWTLLGLLHPLRGLFKMAQERGYVAGNPALAVKLPKLDAAERTTCTEEELEGLLDACEREPDPERRAMTRAVVSVLIYGGLRRKELLDLRVDDVDLAEGRLLIRSGKGRKSRSLYVPEECVAALRAWLAVRQGMGCRHPYLFTTDPRRRMGDNGLNRIMAAVRTMADMGDRRHIMPHSIRHGVATRLLQNGADLRSIQSILGHSDLKTTSMYLHTDELQLKRAADLTRFRDRDRRRVSEERRRPESRESRRTVVGASAARSRLAASGRP